MHGAVVYLEEGGGPQPPTPTPVDGMCDSNWFVNPISAGTNKYRESLEPGADASLRLGTIMILDSSGKKFYTNTSNAFYDLDVDNLLTSNGYVATNSPFRLPSYSIGGGPSNKYWTEMKVFGQLYPTKTWKQFSQFYKVEGPAKEAAWALLLSTDGELKAVRYEGGRGGVSTSYHGVTGREGVGKSIPAITTNMSTSDFYRTTDIKAYSDINTLTATNWDWFEPYTPGSFYENLVDGVIAYNAADKLFYTWGQSNTASAGQSIASYLLRKNPATITESMTPLPATTLNNLLIALGTEVKKPSEEHQTISVGLFATTNDYSLFFITTDNRVVNYDLTTDNYISLSLPAGVNPISFNKPFLYKSKNLTVLGSDGKLYLADNLPTGVAQTGNITKYHY